MWAYVGELRDQTTMFTSAIYCPRRYDDFCMDTEGTYCAIVANPKYLSQWQGPNATYTMHLEVPCDTGDASLPREKLDCWLALPAFDARSCYCVTRADNAGRLVNRSGYLIGGTVSKYERLDCRTVLRTPESGAVTAAHLGNM